ncbi:hypothetical protein MKX03_028981 [Papaver bracteatum]|nr:hypothetical protein MKX03_028981 [Papaver bracteatum]
MAYSLFIYFIYCIFFASISFPRISALNSEGKALLSLFNNSSWNSSNSSSCYWLGIQCDSKHHVISLNLSNYAISGQLGPEIGHLRYIETIYFSINFLSGRIIKEIGNCSNLRYLDISSNGFTGEVPESLRNLNQLSYFSLVDNTFGCVLPKFLFHIQNPQYLYLDSNNFTGLIPDSIGKAAELISLWLGYNQVSGMIPYSIGECTKLEEIVLNDNQLVGFLPDSLSKGRIPLGLGNCKNLNQLILSYNSLSGEIPSSLGNCSRLTVFSTVNNMLTSHIPSSFGLLSELSLLYLNENRLSGKILPEIGNRTSLTSLFLDMNQLEGEITAELGFLINLETLQLFTNNLSGELPLCIWKIPTLENIFVYNNSLSGELPLDITELHHLKNISLFDNQFSGVIPQTLGINSSLVEVELTNNKFFGKIPPHICFGKQLRLLNLGLNQFEGTIPSGVGSFLTLIRSIFKQNMLDGLIPDFEKNHNLNLINGTIPPSFGNCVNLTSLNLSMNKLTWFIPQEVGNLVELQKLYLSDNYLEGPLPHEITKCINLDLLDVGFNSLNGSIPSSFQSLRQLTTLLLSENQFTGGIPDFLQGLGKLSELQFGGNKFGGSIPSSLGYLYSLEYALNLSDNGLIAEIPMELVKLSMLQRLDLSLNNLTGSLSLLGKLHSLIDVNVSYNQFTGPIPETLLKLPNSSSSSFLGNAGLCVSCHPDNGFGCMKFINFSVCDQRSNHEGLSRTKIVLKALAALLTCVLVVLILAFVFMGHRYPEKRIDMLKGEGASSLLNKVMVATENLNERFIIGRGAHGIVFKASLSADEVYALKKLEFIGNKGASVSMIREIKTVWEIRHRNLVRLEDFWLRKDYGLILYKYMQNGSLHDVLHEISPQPVLDWDVRYLHYDCNPTIVHRDIKPKNILLDADMEPRISDFGIAKLIDHSSASIHSISVMGTVEYIPPETAFTTATTMAMMKKWDVYSFGVVLLELITRKKALDPFFFFFFLKDDTGIAKWVSSRWSSKDAIEEIVDPSLIDEIMYTAAREEVMKVMSVDLQCTLKDPVERPQ